MSSQLHEATAHLSILLLALHRFERQFDTTHFSNPLAAVEWGRLIAMRENAFAFVQEQTEKTMADLQAEYGRPGDTE
jgi:hypothetical protein